MNGWTPQISEIERTKNIINSCKAYLVDDPSNAYWKNRLAEARKKLDLLYADEYSDCVCRPEADTPCDACMAELEKDVMIF